MVTTSEVTAMTAQGENPTRINVLSEGWGIRKIARYLRISLPAVLKHVKILEKNGHISRLFGSNKVQYSILPLGLDLLNEMLSSPEKLQIRVDSLGSSMI